MPSSNKVINEVAKIRWEKILNNSSNECVLCLFVCFQFVPRVPSPSCFLGVVITIRCPFPVKLRVVGTLVKTVALGFEYQVLVHSRQFTLPVVRCMASPMGGELPTTVPNHTNERQGLPLTQWSNIPTGRFGNWNGTIEEQGGPLSASHPRLPPRATTAKENRQREALKRRITNQFKTALRKGRYSRDSFEGDRVRILHNLHFD